MISWDFGLEKYMVEYMKRRAFNITSKGVMNYVPEGKHMLEYTYKIVCGEDFFSGLEQTLCCN
jgi:hypothetical protein